MFTVPLAFVPTPSVFPAVSMVIRPVAAIVLLMVGAALLSIVRLVSASLLPTAASKATSPLALLAIRLPLPSTASANVTLPEVVAETVLLPVIAIDSPPPPPAPVMSIFPLVEVTVLLDSVVPGSERPLAPPVPLMPTEPEPVA